MKPKSKQQSERGDLVASGGSQQEMFTQQAANPQKPGGTAHAVKGAAPAQRPHRAAPRPLGLLHWRYPPLPEKPVLSGKAVERSTMPMPQYLSDRDYQDYGDDLVTFSKKRLLR